MMCKNLNKDNFSKVMIHKYPIFERIVMIISALILTLITFFNLIAKTYNNDIELIKTIFLFIVTILYCFGIYFSAFKTYIHFDVNNNKIIISKGLKKEELSTLGMESITVENDPKYPNLFSLNYNFIGYSRKDYWWSTGLSSRLFFGTTKSQRNRLEKFCNECNK